MITSPPSPSVCTQNVMCSVWIYLLPHGTGKFQLILQWCLGLICSQVHAASSKSHSFLHSQTSTVLQTWPSGSMEVSTQALEHWWLKYSRLFFWSSWELHHTLETSLFLQKKTQISINSLFQTKSTSLLFYFQWWKVMTFKNLCSTLLPVAGLQKQKQKASN